MKWLLYLLLPIFWFFMLLEWTYKKIRKLFYYIFYEPEPPRPLPKQKKKKAQGETMNGKAQDKKVIISRKGKPAQDDGMDAQERTLPYITPEPKKPGPVKEEPPEIIFKFPKRKMPKTKGKKNGKERRGMEL